MGVNWRHQIWYGIKVNYEEAEKMHDTESTYEKSSGLRVLFDGMNGEYAIIGKSIYISEDGRDEMADIPMTEILPMPEKDRQDIIEYANKWNIYGQPKIWVFTHFT